MEQNNIEVPTENSNNQRSFLSQYVIVLSILLIVGFGILGAFLLVNKKPIHLTSSISATDFSSPNCTNMKIYTDVTQALQSPIEQICYIDAKAPGPEYVFPSDVVKNPNTRNLVYLGLDNYDLSLMRDSLEVLQDLRALKLTNAKLTTLPNGVDKLLNLEQLDLSGNQLSNEAKQQIREQLPNVKVSF